MKITNNIPEFTMPESITLEQQINLLQQRILELEKELNAQRTNTNLYWNDNATSLGESIGVSHESERELSRILKIWVGKHDGKFQYVYKEVLCSPLPFPEKLLMFAILAGSVPQQPKSPSPMSPDEFFRKMFGGGR